MKVNQRKSRKKPFVIGGVLGRQVRAGGKGLPGKAPHFPGLPWAGSGSLLALVEWWPMEGGGSSCPGPQAPGIPPVSFTHSPGPVYKALGAKESVWPRQLSPEAQRREPKPEARLSRSMPAPGAVGLQFPEPLAPDLWPSGCPEAPGSGPRKGKAEAERASGVGGVHTPS